MTDPDWQPLHHPSRRETSHASMSTDPVVRTALLARRFRSLGAELRDISGPQRDLIIKLWAHGATPAQISHATDLPEAKVRRILGIDADPAAPSPTASAVDGGEP